MGPIVTLSRNFVKIIPGYNDKVAKRELRRCGSRYCWLNMRFGFFRRISKVSWEFASVKSLVFLVFVHHCPTRISLLSFLAL